MSLSKNSRPPEPIRPPHDKAEQMVLHRAWKRLNKNNEHFMLCLVGEEGSGKSLTAIRIAREIDPSFCVDRVLFDVEELLERLKNDEFEPGQAFVLDEAGVSLGRRTWQDRAQVLANQALQLIRSHNLALVFTLPALGELDSQAVSRLQAYYHIRDKVPDEYVQGRWYYIKTDRTENGGDNYTPKPRITRSDGPDMRIDTLRFGPPEGEIIDEYHDAKGDHQQRVYEKALTEMSDDEEDSEDQKKTASEIVDIIHDEKKLSKVVSYHNGHNKWQIDKDLIHEHFPCTHREAKKAKKLLVADADVDPAAAAPQKHTHAKADV